MLIRLFTLASVFSFSLLFSVTDREARLFVEEAYRSGYPLVSAELIRKKMTQGDLRKTRMGEFLHERAFPLSDFPHSRWTNMDILYSTAWVDLSKEPYLLTIPEFNDRLVRFPILSAWNDEVSVIQKPGNYAIVGPSFKGSVQKDWKIIRSPTNIAFIPGNIFSTGTPEDLEQVHALQDGVNLKPLSFDENDTLFTLEDSNEPAMTDQLIEKTLKTSAYFTLLSKALKGNLPTKNQEQVLKQLARVGIVPGTSFDLSSVDPKIAAAMESLPKNIKVVVPYPKGEVIGSWSYSFQEGLKGADFIRRAISNSVSLGDLPQETIHLFTDHDEVNKKLSGAERYILHISKEKLPKVKGTWSLTAYGVKGDLVQNSINRHTVHQEGLKYNADGSLDIFIQNRYPGKRKEDNWLPVPEEKFILMLRVYLPENEILDKNWRMPWIQREYF